MTHSLSKHTLLISLIIASLAVGVFALAQDTTIDGDVPVSDREPTAIPARPAETREVPPNAGTPRERESQSTGGGTTAVDDWSNPRPGNTTTDRPNQEQRREAIQDRAETRQQTLEERKTELETRRQDFQAQQTERRAALNERAQQRIANLSANISNRMEAAIRRIENVIERIESRIEKLNTAGVDTATASRYLDAAKTDIANAKSTLATIDTDVIAAITSNDPKTSWERVRTIYQTTREYIRSAHTNLRQTVEELKTAVRSANESNNGVADAVRATDAATLEATE